MRIISYNLRKHRAAHELDDLVDAHDPDVLCLQEGGDTASLPERTGDLVLAHTTQRNRLGLAIYYRENRFRLVDMAAVSVKKSLHDHVLRPAHERLLGVRLRDIDAGSDFLVASLHAAPLTARNALRRDQIRAALSELSELGWGLPQLIVGDFNYPRVQGAAQRAHARRGGVRARDERPAHLHAVPGVPRLLRLRRRIRVRRGVGAHAAAGGVRPPADPGHRDPPEVARIQVRIRVA